MTLTGIYSWFCQRSGKAQSYRCIFAYSFVGISKGYCQYSFSFMNSDLFDACWRRKTPSKYSALADILYLLYQPQYVSDSTIVLSSYGNSISCCLEF